MKRAIILASGPSLTQADADMAMNAGDWTVIAVNSTWQRVPGCDVIYAGDMEWWGYWHDRIDSPARRWTCHAEAARRYGLNLHQVAPGVYNSGMRAIQFAVSRGAERILLLGFDCSTEKGTHWHGDHPAGLRNPGPASRFRWQAHFAMLRPLQHDTRIINCSRETTLTQFPRQSLRAALNGEKPDGSAFTD
ncbi:hypothetical protein [Escherichia coli]|uniref:hypothetical protein n=1 Tax=Escherichia coli TaxID=562 RepID=UPI00287B4552|nr:hypothetical protein [Escherichia coli]MDS1619830.1 hypothetical protein [Escherichia coli]